MRLERAILHLGRATLRARGPDAAIAWLATRQHGVVARWQLLELGLSRSQVQLRIERGLLRPLFVGVYAVGHSATTREARWLAGVLATGGDGVLGHICAGEHLGILRPPPRSNSP